MKIQSTPTEITIKIDEITLKINEITIKINEMTVKINEITSRFVDLLNKTNTFYKVRPQIPELS